MLAAIAPASLALQLPWHRPVACICRGSISHQGAKLHVRLGPKLGRILTCCLGLWRLLLPLQMQATHYMII